MTEQLATRAIPDVEPNPHFDAWDPTPHFYATVPVGKVALGDALLGGTHQVEGFGRAEQRGQEARRFDLEYIVGQSVEYTARLVLPLDHLLEVKRYTGPGHRWAVTQIREGAAGWVSADGDEQHAGIRRPGLVPDYGSDTLRCGCGTELGNPPADVNVDGYEGSSTLCDACVGSWSIDHTVVRHR